MRSGVFCRGTEVTVPGSVCPAGGVRSVRRAGDRVEVGVYLRGRDGFVAEQFLYLADVGPAREQVGGETVAEGVRTHLLVDSGGRSGRLDGVEHHDARQLPAVAVEEKRIGGFFIARYSAVFAQVGLHLHAAAVADRDEALFAPLAEHAVKPSSKKRSEMCSDVSSDTRSPQL